MICRIARRSILGLSYFYIVEKEDADERGALRALALSVVGRGAKWRGEVGWGEARGSPSQQRGFGSITPENLLKSYVQIWA
jgi:hypothetical protein